MKFAVEAHLPTGLCALLQTAGPDALHTRQLIAQNRTTDEVLNTLSLKEQRVVVTKDTDFYHSHVLHRKPWKLLLVRAGNIRTRVIAAHHVRPVAHRIEPATAGRRAQRGLRCRGLSNWQRFSGGGLITSGSSSRFGLALAGFM